MASSFRRLFSFLLPGWLSDEATDGGRVAYVLSMIVDAVNQRQYSGLVSRFPSRAGATALALIGRDRGIIRGRTEIDAHYAARLKAWRWPRGHRTRGNAFALLEQVSEYFGGVACYAIDVNGNRCDRAADGTETYSVGESWTWDTQPSSNWARFWIVVDGRELFDYPPSLGDSDLWGGSLGIDGYTIGIDDFTHEDARALRGLVRGKRPWKPDGTQAEWVVIRMAGSTEPVPTSAYARWGELFGTTLVKARGDAFRFVSLDPEHNNTYGGDVTRWANDVRLPDNTTESGDETSFPLSTLLPDGSTYAGNVASFPTSVRLLDDGDLPQ